MIPQIVSKRFQQTILVRITRRYVIDNEIDPILNLKVGCKSLISAKDGSDLDRGQYSTENHKKNEVC